MVTAIAREQNGEFCATVGQAVVSTAKPTDLVNERLWKLTWTDDLANVGPYASLIALVCVLPYVKLLV